MFEYHGWARVVFSPTTSEIWDEGQQMRIISQRLSTYLGQLQWGNDAVGMRWINGQLHVWATGFWNHADPIAQEVQDLFLTIGQWAPGSYGLLYTRDEEEGPPETCNAFAVYVLARGALVRRPDAYLSPIVSTIQDAEEDPEDR